MIHAVVKKTLRATKGGKIYRKRTFILYLILIWCLVFSFALGAFFFFNRQVNLLLMRQGSFYLQEVTTKSAERLKEKLDGDFAKVKGVALTLGGLEKLDVDHWLEVIKDDPLFAEFQRIGFILPDGLLYTPEIYGVDFSDRPYFQSVMQGHSVISNVFIDAVHQQPTLVYAVPIVQNHEIVGGFGVGIVIEEYEKYLLMESFSGEGTMHLLGPDGSIILKMGKASIPKRLSLDSLREDFAAGKSGIVQLDDTKNPRLLAYAPVGVEGWVLLLEIPQAFLIRTQRQTTLYSIFFTFLYGLILLIFPYYMLFKRRKYEYSLLRRAYVDELTGIANGTLFEESAQSLLEKEGANYACVLINIRKFKLINDLFGYTFGDALLKQIASMLSSFCLEKELVARKESDRFLLFLEQEEVEERLRAILSSLNQIVLPDTARFKLEVVAGVFFLPKKLAINVCIDRATLALDHLKTDHSSNYLIYDDIIRRQLLGESDLVKGFQEALDCKQFFVMLQPKYNMLTQQVVGAEALVRWNHPTRGLLPPAQFIPLFEEHNLIVELDTFVLRAVCDHLHQWQSLGLANLPISVNQSRAHLDNPLYVNDLINEVDFFGLEHSLLEFEMTESIFLGDLVLLTSVVSSLQAEGFSVSIDDFGSGYSSLNMLKNIKVDFLKLDREFLMEAEDDVRSHKVIQSVIQMAHDLGIIVVAEGVETKKQAEMLMGLGCTLAQGYYYERPISIQAYEKLLSKKETSSH